MNAGTGSSFERALQRRAQAVEAALERYLPGEDVCPHVIHRAMRYSALGGGKRLRGAMVLAAAEAVGGREDVALPVAAAVEMIHTYSLVHDDLPSMDNDVLRRGKPTCHRVFGEAVAILAGDALLTHAFILLARLPEETGMDPARALRIVREVADAGGTGGLVGGQVLDLEAEGKPRQDPELLEAIHSRKTAALFVASLAGGGLAGGGDEDTIEILREYGRQFGLAFQITDDILDVTGSQDKMGKSVGSDARRDKLTYVTMYGVEEAMVRAREASSRALAAAALLPPGEGRRFLEDLAEYVVRRER